MTDFVEEAELLSWAGVGFGDLESYRVTCSLSNLATVEKENGMTKLRFWGKVLGTDADYYVAEAQREGGGDGDAEDADPDIEPSGQGANQYCYYVTTDLSGSWQRLPDIAPRQILAARMVKRLLSGNPKAKVITHPYFDGKEEVLLRAQIARISADTILCIKGFLRKEEEEDAPIEENAEFVSPLPSELLQKQAWTHMLPHVLFNGRTTYKELPDTEDQVLLAKMQEERDADPVREVLRTLDKDNLSWVIKQAGDAALFRNPSDPSGRARSNEVTYVRSLVWPGAVCAARDGRFVNLYVGYALPSGSRTSSRQRRRTCSSSLRVRANRRNPRAPSKRRTRPRPTTEAACRDQEILSLVQAGRVHVP